MGQNHSHSIILDHGNALILQRKFFLEQDGHTIGRSALHLCKPAQGRSSWPVA
jgi:hypothetical protein